MAAYYGNWRSEPFTCKACGWRGLGDELQQGEMFDALYEAECPKCSTVLAVVSYPVIAESRANWHSLSAAERCEVEVVENFNRKFEALALRNPDQLPELDGDPLVLEWDFDREDGNVTVIRHGGVEVWREPALWEGYERFCEVLDILVARYGRRLVDLAPTGASELYLYGDRTSSPRTVAAARARLDVTRRSPAR